MCPVLLQIIAPFCPAYGLVPAPHDYRRHHTAMGWSGEQSGGESTVVGSGPERERRWRGRGGRHGGKVRALGARRLSVGKVRALGARRPSGGRKTEDFNVGNIQAVKVAFIEGVLVLISGTEGEPETETKSEKDEARAVSRLISCC